MKHAKKKEIENTVMFNQNILGTCLCSHLFILKYRGCIHMYHTAIHTFLDF